MKIKDPKLTVEAAIELFGGNQAELARTFELSRMAVTTWKKNGKYLPWPWAHRIAWNYSVNGRPPIREIVEQWDENNRKRGKRSMV